MTISTDEGTAEKASYSAAANGISNLVELLHSAKPGSAYSQAIALTAMTCLAELAFDFPIQIRRRSDFLKSVQH
jgi:hypothetical protein